jgi:hypothetical protein
MLGLDKDDVRLIRCTNCFQIACLVTIVAMCHPCDGDFAQCMSIFADAVFCGVSGCMTAQCHHELKKRDAMASPDAQRMER